MTVLLGGLKSLCKRGDGYPTRHLATLLGGKL
jgi:hypothetical protein